MGVHPYVNPSLSPPDISLESSFVLPGLGVDQHLMSRACVLIILWEVLPLPHVRAGFLGARLAQGPEADVVTGCCLFCP